MADAIISRDDARAQGLKRYSTGEPCKEGHVAERYVASYMCVACCVELLRKRYQDDPEKERNRTRRWRERNPEKAAAADARYRQECPEKRAEAVAKWRKKNPDKVREMELRRGRRFRSEHPEKVAEYNQKWLSVPENRAARARAIKAWRIANPEKFRAILLRRRARKAQAQGDHSDADLVEIFAAQNKRCAYCRSDLRKAKKHVDHIVPLARGGSNGRSNLQFLCAPCNQTKSAKDPTDYAQSIGLLL